jgi:hypothetical protein
VLVLTVIAVWPPGLEASDTSERRGEIGVQVGARRADPNIVPEGDSGVAITWGIEGAWALNRKWALFWDLNFSDHDSPNFCLSTPNCNALTPESHHKVLTFGIERRLRPGPKGGQWVFGFGTGAMDIQWNGAQIHHGIFSFNAGRRGPLGPGTLRWTLRIETGMSGRTDAQFYGALDWARLTNAVVVVGWGFDFGSRYKVPSTGASKGVPAAVGTAGSGGR